MSKPYENTEIDLDTAFVEKLPIKGRIVAVLNLEIAERNLQLIGTASRALRRNGIYELVVTDDKSAKPGNTVHNAKYLCFFEVVHGGIALYGDTIALGDETTWVLKGFDRTHMPNHLNIVAYGEKYRTGKEVGMYTNQEIKILRSS